MAIFTGPGERELLRAVRRLAGAGLFREVRIGIGDDCAVLVLRRGEESVVTTDFSIEDRHFRRNWHPPEAVGYKCLARGLSDIAAMGARPVAAFVSLAVPRELTQSKGRTPSWMTRFYDGLLSLASTEKVTLAGGDLAESPLFAFADIVVVGAAPRGRALLRSTAKAGDILYVTGTLGGAAAELASLEVVRDRRVPSQAQARVMADRKKDHPHFYPLPRLAAGRALLRRRIATACLDISDGLSVDLMHLCEESGLSAEMDEMAIPVHPSATLEQALHGGDDYELLFSASATTRVPKQLGGVAIYAIGRLVKGKPNARVTLTSHDERRTTRRSLPAGGWQHF